VSLFLNQISTGERFTISRHAPGGGALIQIVAAEEIQKWSPTDEETRLYNEATKLLEAARTNSRTTVESLSDEMKQLREKHRSLGQYVFDMKARMSKKAYAVTRVGGDYIAYRDGDREVFLPIHQIQSISRLAQ
jgi:hypothetical protein